MDTADDRPECKLPEGPLTWGDLAKMPDCRIPVPEGGLTINVPSEIHDKHGHALDGDHDPHGAHGCGHRETPEWKAEHPRPSKPKIDPPTTPAVPEAPMAEHNEHQELTVPAPSVPVTTETVGVEAAVAQVKSLLPHDASPTVMIGGAAALAIVGAAMKMGPGILKARAEARERDHEARMKELELRENEKKDSKEDDHKGCAAARGALELRVSGIDSKVSDLGSKVDGVEKKLDEVASKIEKAVSSGPQFDGDFDPEDLEKRLSAIEKSVRPAKSSKPPKKRK